MANPNQLPTPQTDDPIDLELMALRMLAGDPETLKLQLLFMGGIVVAAALESLIVEPPSPN